MNYEQLEKMSEKEVLEYVKRKLKEDGNPLSDIEEMHGLGKSTLTNSLNGHTLNPKTIKFVAEYAMIDVETLLNAIITEYRHNILEKIKKET